MAHPLGDAGHGSPPLKGTQLSVLYMAVQVGDLPPLAALPLEGLWPRHAAVDFCLWPPVKLRNLESHRRHRIQFLRKS